MVIIWKLICIALLYAIHSFLFLKKKGGKARKMEKVPKEKMKKKVQKNSRVVNKSVCHGCILVYSFPMVNFNWGVFLFCVLRECALIIISVSFACLLAMTFSSSFAKLFVALLTLNLGPITALRKFSWLLFCILHFNSGESRTFASLWRFIWLEENWVNLVIF